MVLRDLLERGEPTSIAIAVAGNGTTLTYDQLRRQVDALASRLHQFGIRQEDRVAIVLPNGIEMIVSFLAAAIGCTAAPFNPSYKLDEFRFYLEDTEAVGLIVPRHGADLARSAASEKTLIIDTELDPDGQVRFLSDRLSESTGHPSSPRSNDTALILHTSGTTSRPKRVPLSHANLLASSRTVSDTYKLQPRDVSFCVMPLFHVHGLVASTLATLFSGGTVVVVPRFNPLSFWSSAKEHRATWYSAVPTIHQMLLSRAQTNEIPGGARNLRFIRSCSAPLAADTMARMEEKFGVPVLEAYGMTEAAHQMASNPLPPGVRKPGSVGAATGVRITILDQEGEELPNGERGEVAIKGSSVISGYEHNPEANAECFVNGWFRTGDEGYLDRDGYLTLVGRTKELINRGGEKVSPREVDEVLLAHPSVAEAVCFGEPHRVYGEEVAAAVVLRGPATEAELVAYCKSSLADFKRPKAVHIVDKIPRTATGKVQRRSVAEAITSERG